ncbi:MAG: nitroreductase family protein [Lachnospiraceae bacterium]|nr:nitroreductase family protein [Lachnospiraceae bacterium]
MKKKLKTAISLIMIAIIVTVTSACGTAVSATSSGTATTPTPSSSGSTASAIDIIMNVGTTQAFSDEAVPKEDIQTILQAGLASESAINQQPWFLVAITDKDLMKDISSSGSTPGGGGMPSSAPNGAMPSKPSGAEMPSASGGAMPSSPQGAAPASTGGSGAKASLGDSPLAIIVYMNEKTSSPNPSFDCGLAVQNMYIAAASLGYGTKIISSPTRALNGEDHDKICEKLKVDTSMTAVAVLLVGKTDTGVDTGSSASTRGGISDKAVIIE